MSDWFDRYAPSESRSVLIVTLMAGALSLDMVLEGIYVLTAGMLHEGGLESTLARVGVFVDVTGIAAGWAVLLLGIVGLVASVSLVRGTRDRELRGVGSTTAVPDDAQGRETDPLSVLQTRYAEGEVSDEEFERRLASLLESDEYRDALSDRDRPEKLLE